MHTIDDFKIGTRVKHEKYGRGVVAAISFYQGMIKVVFDNGETGYYYTVATYLDLLSDLTIIKPLISKMETTEEETMQEFEPITKNNIEEVLKYNGWKYQGAYIHYQIKENEFVLNFNILLTDDMFNYNFLCNYGGIKTNDFDEFLAFVQKRVELKPLPKKPEFDFEQYLLDNGCIKEPQYKNTITLGKTEYWIYLNVNTFESSHNDIEYAKTKENADILIAAAKLLEGLK